MKKTLIIVITLLIIGVIVFFVRQGAQNPTLEGNQNRGGGAETTTTENEQNAPDRVVEVGGDEYSFEPATITAEQGERIEFRFTNTGDLPHNFSVRNDAGEVLGETDTIGGGNVDTLTLEMPESETTLALTAFCSVPGHEENGMIGEITVE